MTRAARMRDGNSSSSGASTSIISSTSMALVYSNGLSKIALDDWLKASISCSVNRVGLYLVSSKH